MGDIGPCIGGGAFGRIHKSTANIEIVYKVASMKHKAALLFEFETWSKLDCQHIVRVYEWVEFPATDMREVGFSMERAKFSLDDALHVHERAEISSVSDCLMISRQILFAVDYLHKREIRHCDLKVRFCFSCFSGCSPVHSSLSLCSLRISSCSTTLSPTNGSQSWLISARRKPLTSNPLSRERWRIWPRNASKVARSLVAHVSTRPPFSLTLITKIASTRNRFCDCL
jgi:serine/threonine protein kinase